jgi:cytidyltransferase-like protein
MNTNKNYKVMIIGGCFDVLHPGHLDFLSKTKKLCDYLIVLLEPDEKVKLMKGNSRPINNEKIRIKNLENTGFADEVILLPMLQTNEDYEKFIKKTIAPLLHCSIAKNNKIPSNETMKQCNNVFSFGITKNDRNTKKNENIRRLGKKMNIEVIEVNELLPNHSTTKLLKFQIPNTK